LLDEPSNDLDVATLRSLEESLMDFSVTWFGSIIFFFMESYRFKIANNGSDMLLC
jgi:hypothetical protein